MSVMPPVIPNVNTKRETIIAVIPARFGSTRFPGKALIPIKGKPMIQWVYERTVRSKLINRVIVATDDDRIVKAVGAFGGEAVMTSPDHSTGTDRIAEVAKKLTCDIIVNVQGDEPLIQPEMIDEAIAPLLLDTSLPMSTLCKKIDDSKEVSDPNVVKVVLDKTGCALYFSRAPIPWNRDQWAGANTLSALRFKQPMYKHIGLYVYRRDFLLTFAGLSPTNLESVEKLEQLRALEHNYKIRTVETAYESFGVDIPEDLSKILKHLDES